VLAFIEGAQLHVQDPLPSQEARSKLSSVGLGLRLKALRTFTAALDIGFPFTDTQYTRAGEPRVLFKVAYEF
jgi:hemolysin activation/secretion protein